MKYKGFTFEKQFSPGSTFNALDDGRITPRRPRKEDTTYNILDPMENDSRHTTCDSIVECKVEVDRLLKILGLKDNKPATWQALDLPAQTKQFNLA